MHVTSGLQRGVDRTLFFYCFSPSRSVAVGLLCTLQLPAACRCCSFHPLPCAGGARIVFWCHCRCLAAGSCVPFELCSGSRACEPCGCPCSEACAFQMEIIDSGSAWAWRFAWRPLRREPASLLGILLLHAAETRSARAGRTVLLRWHAESDHVSFWIPRCSFSIPGRELWADSEGKG
ncbi:hypothetical protein B0I37DRAFT_131495 [Chaetomium sp. MPI-CAGE-AT-0009]|nr:hypothetical protein B0I37DRAFT_131495 [Chaetomium sp. MPI-CAGE-AT-0009]